MGGAPLAGNPLAGLFYPPNWLFFLLPVAPTFHLLFALHLAGAGIALYGFARWGYRCSPFAALIGGLGYALSPKLIAHLSAGHVGMLQATCWLPVATWLLHGATEPCAIEESPEGNRARLRRARRRALGCGTALALAYLADPRVALLGALLLAGAGIGLFELVPTAQAWATYDSPVEPNGQRHNFYQEQLLPLFRGAYQKYRQEFQRLQELEIAGNKVST